MEMVKQMQAGYESAKAEREKATSYLQQIQAKREDLAGNAAALQSDMAEKKACVDAAVRRYLTNEVTEVEMAETRQALHETERKYQDHTALVNILEEEIEKGRSTIKEASEKETRAKEKLWRQISRVETALARELGAEAIKRAYLSRRRSSQAGTTPSLLEFLDEVFEALHIREDEEDALLRELEGKYGAPRF